ncbi:MAG TPA: TIM-barrel domain-containing protein [Lentimicrobium sp.]|nr:TIM-barrel domain-containing protein [Lentimicrobium sp.]
MKLLQSVTKALLLIAIFTETAGAQSIGRTYEGFKEMEYAVEVYVNDGKYLIKPMNDKIMNITFYPKELLIKDLSYAVAMEQVKLDPVVIDSPETLIVDTKGIDISIRKDPFKVTFLYNDKLLLEEKEGFIKADSSWMFDFTIKPDEILYGGGARALGMNRRGNKLTLYNRAHYGYETRSELMNYTLPLVLSSNIYAVLFDNAGIGYLDLDSKHNNTIAYETYHGTPNYFVIAGNDWFDLVSQYTLLTGRQPLPPRWALGNFSSRFGYHSQKETEETVEAFLKEGIPLDAVIIDIYWFGKDIKGEMGNLYWYWDSFPEPDKMIGKFEKKGVKTLLVTEPFILTTSKRWNEAVKMDVLAKNSEGKPYTYDFYFGNTGLIDIFKPQARDWFWNIYSNLIKEGIAGQWGDLGEPEVHPADIVHAEGTGNELHNAYGHEWAKMIYEGYQKDFPSVRPFILMRAGYAGSQRYGMIPWSGDVNRSWGGLQSQPEIALQMGMQGLAYMHSDLGGFAGGDSIDDELYVRWLQYGVFQPIYRPHAQEHIPAEPVFQKPRTKYFASKAIELRYRMLPYNYSLAFRNSIYGYPLMTPLFFYDKDPQLLTYDSAYMWGDAFLVAPVKKPGQIYQDIYLPKGYSWTDFFTGQVYKGGIILKYNPTYGNIPVFVKGGSFIPLKTEAVSTVNYTLDEFEMHYYTDPQVSSSSYSLYNDDGLTADAYNKDEYEIIDFTSANSDDQLTISVQKKSPDEKYQKINNKIRVNVHNLQLKPQSILINGRQLNNKNISWNPVTNKLMFDIECTISNTEIVIKK